MPAVNRRDLFRSCNLRAGGGPPLPVTYPDGWHMTPHWYASNDHRLLGIPIIRTRAFFSRIISEDRVTGIPGCEALEIQKQERIVLCSRNTEVRAELELFTGEWNVRGILMISSRVKNIDSSRASSQDHHIHLHQEMWSRRKLVGLRRITRYNSR